MTMRANYMTAVSGNTVVEQLWAKAQASRTAPTKDPIRAAIVRTQATLAQSHQEAKIRTSLSLADILGSHFKITA